MNTKMVTIAIPAYKDKYLRETIQSVLNQTYPYIEVIIVNDQSPYDITSIVKSFSDSRIRYLINDENIGGEDIVAQWNKCLSYANGDFFCLLCDDDVYEPCFVEELVMLAEKYPYVDVFRARVRVIDKNGMTDDLYPSLPEYETVYEYMWQKLKGLRPQTISEFMYRTSRIRDVGGYFSLPRAWASDSLSVYLFGKANGIVSTNKVLTRFRQSGENISSDYHRDSLEKMRATVMCRAKLRELFEDCDDETIRFLLEKYEPLDYDRRVQNILQNCPWSHFLQIATHYDISKKQLLKAVVFRLVRMFR